MNTTIHNLLFTKQVISGVGGLNNPSPTNSTVQKSNLAFFMKQKSLIVLLVLTFLSFNQAFASHFRFGNISWDRISETPTTVTIQINVSLAWRLTAAPSSASLNITGGAGSSSVTVSLSNVTDPSGGWTNSSGNTTVTLTKSANPYLITYFGCCKISTISNNHDENWNIFSTVNTNSPGSSPVTTIPAIINFPVGLAAATYSVPAFDPDAGSTLTYRLATAIEMDGGTNTETQPPGLSINSSTGVITFNTIGKTVGQQWNAAVVITDNHGNQTDLDFLINMTNTSNPPVFDYSVTPANSFVYNIIAGQNLTFNVKATDVDPGSTVSLSVSGLPIFITNSNFSSSTLGTTGNPILTTFSWTPAGAQIGTTTLLNFIATDNVGAQATTFVTINVVAEPAPVFIAPTAAQNSVRQIVTGALFEDTIRANSTLGSNVSIAFVTGNPGAATYSPAIPTSGADPGQTIMSWTPVPADFGPHNFSYQATIAAFPTIFTTRNFQIIVNTPPAFSSTPILTATPGIPYTYNVTINDPNIPYGDTVDIVGTTIPSWLTLVSTGNGTATLSGTPTMGDVGIHPVALDAEDIYHHGNPDHVDQLFSITVGSPCSDVTNPTITCPTNVNTNSTTAGGTAVYFHALAHDNLPGVVITYSQDPGTIFPVGVTNVTATATDACGNIATCNFDVTVTLCGN